MSRVEFLVNGEQTQVEASISDLLIDTIRNTLNLTGTHKGCETGQCGACTLHINSQPAKACSVLTHEVQGAQITTIEGLSPHSDSLDDLTAVQAAFAKCHGLQCGFCTSGMVMLLEAFLEHNPEPSRKEVCAALEGNICRCTGYQSIVDAAMLAAKDRREGLKR